ncbi:MAG: hypothetical protein PHO10_06330 [Gemmiger sp.]|nr:hypothetical protein [Gemmiger sp.]
MTIKALDENSVWVDFATPETADGPVYEAQLTQTVYAPSAVHAIHKDMLAMETLPQKLFFTKNKAYQYCPYQILGYAVYINGCTVAAGAAQAATSNNFLHKILYKFLHMVPKPATICYNKKQHWPPAGVLCAAARPPYGKG